ncbi:MAG: hypothetical protein JNG84_06050 [Archangium sp.]|nr:hypothetical protein [Archangium sp.]
MNERVGIFISLLVALSACLVPVEDRACVVQAPCPEGYVCDEGRCSRADAGLRSDAGGGGDGGGAPCSASSCSGCCADVATCIPPVAQTAAACGSAGVVCSGCPLGWRCELGACIAGPACGPSTCAGCCEQGRCLPLSNQSNVTCGSRGVLCSTCPTGASCVVGDCLGAFDAGAADASIPDAGLRDAGVVDAGGGVFDAGRPDAGTPDAGLRDAGSVDAGVPDAGRPDAGAPDAGAPDAGRIDSGVPDAGRADAGLPDAGRVDSGVAFDAGAPDAGRLDAGVPGVVGSPCQTTTDCAGTPGAFCLTELRDGGEPSGFVGGYCLMSCETAPCATGACGGVLEHGVYTKYCFSQCGTIATSCRAEYLCGFAINGTNVCAPRCGNPGAECPIGTMCHVPSGFCL